MIGALPPRKTRLALAAASVAAHVGAVVALGLEASRTNVLEPLNVDVIPQGDYMVDTVAIAGAAASEAVEQHQMQEPQPEPQPETKPSQVAQAKPSPQPVSEPAKAEPQPGPQAVVAPDPRAVQAAIEAREQSRLSAKQELARQERAREVEAERVREKRLRERRHRLLLAHRDEMRNARSSNQGGSEGHRAGAANGVSARAARASYGAIISAELNRHKFYPPGARAGGETGSVGVSFTVGGSGRIAGHSIYRSSGSSALDGAAHAMMASAHAPPPPGGSFHGSIVINFNLGR